MNSRISAMVAVFFALQTLVVLFGANGPFNDEGLYVLTGKVRLMRGDASLVQTEWLGGSVHLFPLMSAIAYNALGLAGSRLVSVLFFSIALFFFGAFVRCCFDARASSWAVAMLAANGLFFSFAHLAVYDSVALAGVAGLLWSAAEVARSGERRWIVRGALCGGLAIAAKYSTAIVVLPGLAIPLVLTGPALSGAVLRMGLGVAAVTTTFLVLTQGAHVPMSALVVLRHHAALMTRTEVFWNAVYVCVVPVLLSLLGFVHLLRSRPALAWLLFGAGLAWPCLHVLMAQHISLPKDSVYGCLFLYPMVGDGMTRAWRSRRPVALCASGLALLAGTFQSYVQDRAWPDIRPLADSLVPKLAPTDRVAYGTAWDLGVYAVSDGHLQSADSVIDAWTHSYRGIDLCRTDWIVGVAGSTHLDIKDQLALSDVFSREARRCKFEPIARFPGDYYYVSSRFPFVEKTPKDLVLYRAPHASP